MLNAAILASGNGSNAQRMFDLTAAGTLSMNIRLVLCNRPGARVLERARQAGLPSLCLDHTTFPDREHFDRAMIAAIREAGADTIVLAGFMRMLTPEFLHAFPGRVINIHPALLPSFPGVHGSADANAYGVKISGCTVHFVDEIMDHGAVIAQAAVPHLDGEDADALQQRIHTMEHRIYPQALQWLAENRLVLEGRHIRLLPGNRPLATPPDNALVWPPLEAGF
ncbi:MAG TPA: phosphoribosylglycinamide formyltransferase [Candidatus Avidesulfovibrio excrementigallinarum]|nr:phosphoribosylglycinamide formyltransferase [Candidatus Avidesulfovibrio excrementigallinarum]